MENYATIRDKLIFENQKFDTSLLKDIPYENLVLCALAPSQESGCSLKLVRDEKLLRRTRFVSMLPYDLERCNSLLNCSHMYEDVHYQIELQQGLRWSQLTSKTRAWAKLLCIYNHTDDLLPRIDESISLLRKVVDFPEEEIQNFTQKLKTLGYLYPKRISEIEFREKIFEIIYQISRAFTEEESKQVKSMMIQDFSCTSDCFRVPFN